MRRKSQELEELMAIGREAGFTPRDSLARTAPQEFSSPLASIMETTLGLNRERAGKRQITSTEEDQERTRRCDERHAGPSHQVCAPPVAGILTGPPPARTTSPVPMNTPNPYVSTPTSTPVSSCAPAPASAPVPVPATVTPAPIPAPVTASPAEPGSWLAGLSKVQLLDEAHIQLQRITT
ncbi:unnamed protein product [Euphydryas editha]|uniref:Uncharacterized protein n=1 Tax=Euphydryas editha TaxID=104508 RepID=A0AAU9T7C4_EUPED|nr:unnamed protein product [Euphydryas editha]